MLFKRIGGKQAAVMKDLVQAFLPLKMCLHVLSVVLFGRGCEQNCTFSHYKIINEILTTSTGEKTKGDKLCDNDTQALVRD